MTSSTDPSDRRVNRELRARFVLIYAVVKPFFLTSNQWGGQSHEHFAYRAVKEQFPDLSAQDCYIAVATARRMAATGEVPT